MEELEQKVRKVLHKTDPKKLREQIAVLEGESSASDFWLDSQTAAKKMQQLSDLQKKLASLQLLEDYLVALEIGETVDEKAVVEKVDELEATLYFSGEYDSGNAIISIHSGQGGVEAMDWAEILFRMYDHFFTDRGWKTEELEYDRGSEAGIKTVTIAVSGDFAYGFLKYEAGVHRLVRLSPFNADNLRQTSFALVEVLPEVDDESQIQIREEDVDWDFFRAGGHGGQNVNKVSSAVRLTHKPSGLVVTSQKERDQSRNREIAMRLLKGKLIALEEEKRREEEMRLKGKYLTPGWGNQIRNYVLHPYHLVKDTRTEYEETDTDAVLNGKLDGFINSELHYFAKGETEETGS